MEQSRVLRKGRRKPNVPVLNESTGGTGPVGNSDAVCRAVPSPPRVIAKSTLDASTASVAFSAVCKPCMCASSSRTPFSTIKFTSPYVARTCSITCCIACVELSLCDFFTSRILRGKAVHLRLWLPLNDSIRDKGRDGRCGHTRTWIQQTGSREALPCSQLPCSVCAEMRFGRILRDKAAIPSERPQFKIDFVRKMR